MSAPRPSIAVRLAARVLDYVILGAVGGALGKALGFGFVWLGVTSAATLAYFVAADVMFGRTLGKAALGLDVKGTDGARPSLKAAVAREAFVVLGAIPFVGPLLALAAWIAMLVTIRSSPLGQGFHDRWAGTQVERRG